MAMLASIPISLATLCLDLGDRGWLIDAGDGTGHDISCGDGDITVLAGQGTACVDLGNGQHSVTAGGNGNWINLGDGAAFVDASAGTGNDIRGGDGDMTVLAGQGTACVTLGNGAHTVSASGNANWIDLGVGPATVTLGSGSGSTVRLSGPFDVNFTSAGNTLDLFGAMGAGSIRGLASGDTIIFESSAGPLSVASLTASALTVQLGGITHAVALSGSTASGLGLSFHDGLSVISLT